MATVPLSGTNIRLLSSVPFSNDYKHTRWFENQSQQLNYFTNRPVVHSMTDANFQRIEGKTFIAVNKSIDELWGSNYVMFQNEQYNTKWFYGFVTKLEYVQKKTTYVHFEIDVIQTWRFEMSFKPSYVVREHCRLWNTDDSPVINTVDEGLNYGTEYEIAEATQYKPTANIFFLVIIAKSTLHVADEDPRNNYIKATLNGSPQPLSYYVHPFYINIDFPIDATIDGSTQSLSGIIKVLSTIYTQESAVNNIVSMYITQHIGINVEYDSGNNAIILNPNHFEVADVGSSDVINTLYVKELSEYITSDYYCGNKYDGFASVSESKLLMYPYAETILTDFKGNQVTLKNEYISSQDLYVDVMGSLGLSNKVAFIPRDYLNGNVFGAVSKTKLAIENALIDTQPNDVSVITDMLAAYIQGNRNSLLNQAQTITFNGVADTIGGAISGFGNIATGNIGGALQSGVSMAKGGGNAVLQLQGMQAKIKDIDNQPPSLAKMGSNTAFSYGNDYTGFYVVKKQITQEYREKLSDFFKMYGYKVNELKVPNFHTRSSWNYIETNSCNITGNFNNDDLVEIKSVFDGGITLWHVDDVQNYALGNGVIA